MCPDQIYLLPIILRALTQILFINATSNHYKPQTQQFEDCNPPANPMEVTVEMLHPITFVFAGCFLTNHHLLPNLHKNHQRLRISNIMYGRFRNAPSGLKLQKIAARNLNLPQDKNTYMALGQASLISPYVDTRPNTTSPRYILTEY